MNCQRAIYEDELWVLLCVHDSANGGIPHLEWYADLRSAYEHKPLSVQGFPYIYHKN